MKCPHCKKARLKRLRTYIQGLRVRRENLCPKCGTRPVTIEMDEAAYLGEIQERDLKIENLKSELYFQGCSISDLRYHLKALLSFAVPDQEPSSKPQRSKKAVSRKISRKK